MCTTPARTPTGGPGGSSSTPGGGPSLPFGLTFTRLIYILLGGTLLYTSWNAYLDSNDPARKARRAGNSPKMIAPVGGQAVQAKCYCLCPSCWC